MSGGERERDAVSGRACCSVCDREDPGSVHRCSVSILPRASRAFQHCSKFCKALCSSRCLQPIRSVSGRMSRRMSGRMSRRMSGGMNGRMCGGLCGRTSGSLYNDSATASTVPASASTKSGTICAFKQDTSYTAIRASAPTSSLEQNGGKHADRSCKGRIWKRSG